MSDLHHLPLLGHDMPEYVNNEPLKAYYRSAIADVGSTRRVPKVFKEGAGWLYACFCIRPVSPVGSSGVFARDYAVGSWRLAFDAALKHAKECCR